MTDTKSILPADMPLLAELSNKLQQTIEDMFLNKLTQMMKEEFSTWGIPLDEFINELARTTLQHLSKIHTQESVLLFHGQPSRFEYKFLYEILDAAEKSKREIAKKKNYETYDVEKDIAQTRVSFDREMSERFKMELKLWKLIDESRWDDALSIAHAIDLQREHSDEHLRIEIANWKQFIAAHLGYSDIVFKSIASIIDTTEHGVAYDQQEFTKIITLLLQHELTAFKISFTSYGNQKALQELSPVKFFEKQGDEFRDYLTGKIADAVFKSKTIRDETTFRNFLRSSRKAIVESYKLGNIYVDEILY